MKTIKGPAIFLAQFAGDNSPFNSLKDISRWAASLGYKGVQIPTWDSRLFDLKRAAESKPYCDEIRGILASNLVELTELSTHLQGQLVAVHPAYDEAFDGFAPKSVHGNPSARQAWAVEQLKYAAKASANLGLSAHVTFSGALAWPYLYPWPQRPPGLVETAFEELAKRWRPILEVFDAVGIDLCFEIHPGEDLHDGVTFEMFLERIGGHKRCNILYDPSHFVLRQLDYLEQYDFPGWAVLEWECCLKNSEQGAREGAPFIARHIIQTAERAFDDFAKSGADSEANRRMLGLARKGA